MQVLHDLVGMSILKPYAPYKRQEASLPQCTSVSILLIISLCFFKARN